MRNNPGFAGVRRLFTRNSLKTPGSPGSADFTELPIGSITIFPRVSRRFCSLQRLGRQDVTTQAETLSATIITDSNYHTPHLQALRPRNRPQSVLHPRHSHDLRQATRLSESSLCPRGMIGPGCPVSRRRLQVNHQHGQVGGVMPLMRPACGKSTGRMRESFCEPPCEDGEPRQNRSRRNPPRPIDAGDVGLLTADIAGVFSS